MRLAPASNFPLPPRKRSHAPRLALPLFGRETIRGILPSSCRRGAEGEGNVPLTSVYIGFAFAELSPFLHFCHAPLSHTSVTADPPGGRGSYRPACRQPDDRRRNAARQLLRRAGVGP